MHHNGTNLPPREPFDGTPEPAVGAGLVAMRRAIDRVVGELAAEFDASVHVQFWRHVAGQMVQALKKDDAFIDALADRIAEKIVARMGGQARPGADTQSQREPCSCRRR